jgi:4-nitrophenyl phosphatase
VLDLDGVVRLGPRAVPGAAGAVARLLGAGEDVLFVTNSAYRSVAEVEAELEGHGIDAHGRVLTSAVAAASLVVPGERVRCCGGPGLRTELLARGALVVDDDDVGLVDAVVVGYDPAFDYTALTRAMRAIRAGARFVAANQDATYPTDEGLLPGNGAIVAAIETASGVAPVVAGKPHPPMLGLVRDRLGPEGMLVGDRPDTDGAFARALGYRFALVLTGVTSAADLPVQPEPTVVAPDLAAVVDRWDRTRSVG